MAKSPPNSFALQFPPAQIKQLAERYVRDDDTEAFKAGERIKAGDSSRANIEVIFRWKTNNREFPACVGTQMLKSGMPCGSQSMLRPNAPQYRFSAGYPAWRFRLHRPF